MRHKIQLVFVLTSISVISFSQDSTNVKCAFVNTDSSYAFYGTFKVNADINCLMKICFEYDHISKLAPDAKEVTQLEKGDRWNKIKYVFQRFKIFENTSVWYRKQNFEKYRIDFFLLSSENNHELMPRLLTSYGFYKFTKQDDRIKVEYYQSCQLQKGTIAKMYINAVKKAAAQFMDRLLEYSLEICGIIK
ncbi:MAG: hypothetical protein JXB49_12850 [Bacteroidales bacterium]|nr:hypothetical protein [Bacteroidales bacterium]